ncbi:hypothetical protein, partial [Aminobacter niigataensis]|uniref:hypothetical protein n=1 Tax=Aminobacter niigataensis TaxID=83265 RepID=UPI0031D6823C
KKKRVISAGYDSVKFLDATETTMPKQRYLHHGMALARQDRHLQASTADLAHSSPSPAVIIKSR